MKSKVALMGFNMSIQNLMLDKYGRCEILLWFMWGYTSSMNSSTAFNINEPADTTAVISDMVGGESM